MAGVKKNPIVDSHFIIFCVALLFPLYIHKWPPYRSLQIEQNGVSEVKYQSLWIEEAVIFNLVSGEQRPMKAGMEGNPPQKDGSSRSNVLVLPTQLS